MSPERIAEWLHDQGLDETRFLYVPRSPSASTRTTIAGRRPFRPSDHCARPGGTRQGRHAHRSRGQAPADPRLRPSSLVAIAGLPDHLAADLPAQLNRVFRSASVIAAPKAPWLASYDADYAERLYSLIVDALRRREPCQTRQAWQTNLVLLYVPKDDASERVLFDKLGLESPHHPDHLRRDDPPLPARNSNERNRALNAFLASASQALRHATTLLLEIASEVGVRDNRTCLLLPRRNFGDDFERIAQCVHRAAQDRLTPDQFRRRLRQLVQRLSKTTQGHFRGAANLILRAPPKARLRHGVSPTWAAVRHRKSCIVRGHIRFGAPFDPQFHYDCDIPTGHPRDFPSCHSRRSLPRQRRHANIAPNDNVR